MKNRNYALHTTMLAMIFLTQWPSFLNANDMISWDGVNDLWEIQVVRNNSDEIVKNEIVNDNSFSLEGLESNVEYYVKVRTINMVYSGWVSSGVFTLTSTTTFNPRLVSNLVFKCENQTLKIISEVEQLVKIFSLDGSLKRDVGLSKGETIVRGLEKGIYLINNQKIAIR